MAKIRGGGVGQCHEFSTAQEANAILENHTRMPSTIQIKRLDYGSSDVDIDMKFHPQSVVRWINAQHYNISGRADTLSLEGVGAGYHLDRYIRIQFHADPTMNVYGGSYNTEGGYYSTYRIRSGSICY